jgi:hypothetical protein
MTYAGIEARHFDPFTDRGDGVLVLIRPTDEVPKTFLLSRVVPELARLVADYNLRLPTEAWQQRSIRLRVAVHAGEVHYDGLGYSGEVLDIAFRLLDAPQFKARLPAGHGKITAVYPGDDSYAASADTLTQIVTRVRLR